MSDTKLAILEAENAILREHNRALFSALFEFHSAFWNNNQKSSLKEWNDKLKKADTEAQKLLGPKVRQVSG